MQIILLFSKGDVWKGLKAEVNKEKFPVVWWGDTRAEFIPRGGALPAHCTRSAALLFAFHEDRLVTADIQGRGWCILGGHLEEGETPRQAVVREAMEEGGVKPDHLNHIGWYVLTPRGGIPDVVPSYVARVASMVARPEGFESNGVALMTRDELRQRYYRYDELLDAVFNYVFRRCPALLANREAINLPGALRFSQTLTSE